MQEHRTLDTVKLQPFNLKTWEKTPKRQVRTEYHLTEVQRTWTRILIRTCFSYTSTRSFGAECRKQQLDWCASANIVPLNVDDTFHTLASLFATWLEHDIFKDIFYFVQINTLGESMTCQENEIKFCQMKLICRRARVDWGLQAGCTLPNFRASVSVANLRYTCDGLRCA